MATVALLIHEQAEQNFLSTGVFPAVKMECPSDFEHDSFALFDRCRPPNNRKSTSFGRAQ